MQFEKNDYLIVELDNKKHLGHVLNLAKKAKKPSQLVLEKGIESDEPTLIEFRKGDVLCNLGPVPPRGSKVLGIQVDIFEDFHEVPNYPFRIYSYRELEDRELETLMKVLARARKILKEKDAFAFTDMVERIILKPNSGKMQGFYKHRNTKAINSDEVGLTPVEMTSKDDLLFIVLHEFAHGVWFRQVPKDIQAKWAKLFAKRADLNRSAQDVLFSLFNLVQAMQKEGQSFSEIGKGLRTEYEDEFAIWSDVLKYIKKTWHIDKEEAESLMRVDSKKFFAMWPSVTDITVWKADVSDYANTNVKEFFAESVAFWLTGTALPADVEKYLKNTFKRLIKYFDTKE